MKILRTTDRNFRYDFGKVFKRQLDIPENVFKLVSDVLDDIKRIGDQALHKYTVKFDQHDIAGKNLEVSAKEINQALKLVSAEDKKMLESVAARLEEHYKQEQPSKLAYKKNDTDVKVIHHPLERVGIYVPGGKATYPSQILMSAVPAKIAGVNELILCSPWMNGESNPLVLAAAHIAGIKHIFKIGGAQAIAAMAFGTKSIPKVDKIVGAGGLYVSIAKKLVFGEVAVDMIAGPSELVILGDGTVSPAHVASDIVAQSEMDELVSTLLITNNSNYAIRVEGEVRKQLLRVTRKSVASESIKKRGLIVLVRTLKEGIDLINEMAPQNLEICTKDADKVTSEIRHAGKIFVGAYSPEALGDYFGGPAHILPTYGTARFFGPLSVQDFMTSVSVIKFNEVSFKRVAPQAIKMAQREGLSAHAAALELRLKDL